jgi:hypothetical protein
MEPLFGPRFIQGLTRATDKFPPARAKPIQRPTPQSASPSVSNKPAKRAVSCRSEYNRHSPLLSY